MAVLHAPPLIARHDQALAQYAIARLQRHDEDGTILLSDPWHMPGYFFP